jgi:hypothetical protein
MGGGMISLMIRLFSGTESFMRESPPVAEGEKVAKDLFT